jgi:hypothetical protein
MPNRNYNRPHVDPKWAELHETRMAEVPPTWRHVANIGLIVFALADHDAGNWGDCSINSPIVSIIDSGEPAAVLLQALAAMGEEEAASILFQLAPKNSPLE